MASRPPQIHLDHLQFRPKNETIFNVYLVRGEVLRKSWTENRVLLTKVANCFYLYTVYRPFSTNALGGFKFRLLLCTIFHLFHSSNIARL